MSTTTTNGQSIRKTLASQLDRLDGIIDTLGDGLNQAVADAVRDAVTLAVQQAVEAVLREVLNRPELLRQLAGQTIPVAEKPAELKPAQPSKLKKLLGWMGAKIGNGWSWLREKLAALPGTIRTKAGSAGTILASKMRGLGHCLRKTAGKTWELRWPVSLSLLIGLGVCGVGVVTGPMISTVLLGLTTTALSMTGFVVAPFLRVWRGLHQA